MDWQDYIDVDPDVEGGKPVFKGTFLPVDFVINLFAQGWSAQDVMENYPVVSKEALAAVLELAGQAVNEKLSGG